MQMRVVWMDDEDVIKDRFFDSRNRFEILNFLRDLRHVANVFFGEAKVGGVAPIRGTLEGGLVRWTYWLDIDIHPSSEAIPVDFVKPRVVCAVRGCERPRAPNSEFCDVCCWWGCNQTFDGVTTVKD